MKNCRNIIVQRRNRVSLVTGVLHVQPDRPRLRAGDRLRDESQATQALLYPGIISQQWLTPFASAHVLHEATVDVCKGLEMALRMPGRDSSHSFGRRAQIALPRPQPLPGTAGALVEECVRLLLMPFQPRLGSINTNREPVLVAAGDLRANQRSPGSATEAQQNIGVVIQTAARDHGAQVRAQ